MNKYEQERQRQCQALRNLPRAGAGQEHRSALAFVITHDAAMPTLAVNYEACSSLRSLIYISSIADALCQARVGVMHEDNGSSSASKARKIA
jgi:hypothetical protein